jgi:transposase
VPAHFRRRAARRGAKRAIVAVGHTIRVIAPHLPRRGTTYRDLGADHGAARDADRVRRHAVQRREHLGYTVTLEKVA